MAESISETIMRCSSGFQKLLEPSTVDRLDQQVLGIEQRIIKQQSRFEAWVASSGLCSTKITEPSIIMAVKSLEELIEEALAIAQRGTMSQSNQFEPEEQDFADSDWGEDDFLTRVDGVLLTTDIGAVMIGMDVEMTILEGIKQTS